MRRFRNIPPLQYLLGFEAATRLGSFGKAADELGLTQSAISHQMRLLEERVGQPLFLRHGRGIKLTDAGRDYQRTVGKSLGQLEDGYRNLAPYRKPGSVVIYAPRDFASRWLMPRLEQLLRSVPQCDPWIDSSGQDVDFSETEVSIVIKRAPEAPAGLQSQLLANDVLSPVMSPPNKLIKTPADLLNCKLIHTERTETWRDWFELAGVESCDTTAGMDFLDGDLAIMAAERGLGVALASLPLAAEAIAQENLIQPLPLILKTNHAWYALTNEKELADPITKAVWHWFQTQIF